MARDALCSGDVLDTGRTCSVCGVAGHDPRCPERPDPVEVEEPVKPKRKMGLACLSPERRREIARLGGIKRMSQLTKKDPT